jgi:hypothetical protein
VIERLERAPGAKLITTARVDPSSEGAPLWLSRPYDPSNGAAIFVRRPFVVGDRTPGTGDPQWVQQHTAAPGVAAK